MQRLLELEAKHDRLVKQHGPRHAKVQEAREQIARLNGDVNEVPADPRQAQAAALLKSIEQGLKSVEGMRAEVEQRFQHDLAESNKSEIGQLGESNLRKMWTAGTVSCSTRWWTSSSRPSSSAISAASPPRSSTRRPRRRTGRRFPSS